MATTTPPSKKNMMEKMHSGNPREEAIMRNVKKSMEKVDGGDAIKVEKKLDAAKPKRRGIVSFIGNLLPQVAYMQAITDAEETQGSGCVAVVSHGHGTLEDWKIVAVSENIEDFLGARLKQAALVQHDAPEKPAAPEKDDASSILSGNKNARLKNSPSGRSRKEDSSPTRGEECFWIQKRSVQIAIPFQ